MKKRILSLFLSAAVLLSAGCSSGQSGETTTTPVDTTTTTESAQYEYVGYDPEVTTSGEYQYEYVGDDPEVTTSGEYQYEYIGDDPEITASEDEAEPSPGDAAAVLLSAGCSSGQSGETTTTPADTTTTTTIAASEEPVSETEAPETTDPETTTSGADEAEPSQSDAAAEFYDGPLTPAVWKVTDPESGNSMHMMGTIHIVPDREPVVPDYVTAIYEAADGIAVEYDTTKINSDFVLQLQYISYFVLSDGTVIDEHLSADILERARETLTSIGYNPDQFVGYNAAYWETLLTSGLMMSIEGMRESGIDVSFIMKAKQDGKEVRSIEALEDQLTVLTMLSDGYYDWAIGELLEMDSEEFEESFRLLYSAWAEGNTDLFDEIESEEADEIPEEFAEEYEKYNRALCQERNVGMAERAAEYIKNGDNLFYMVGFAHFCGEGSVLELLEEKGFTVERVY